MIKTPSANRLHIAIYGKTNAGKSSLLNAIIGQDVSLVSEIRGTTTDPVSKPMELLPFGPVVFIDTAGLSDESALGQLRMERSRKILERTDFAIYVIDSSEDPDDEYLSTLKQFKRFGIEHMLVFNKIDEADPERISELKERYPQGHFVSASKEENILKLKDELIKALESEDKEPPILGDLLPYGSTVVMVVPIDSEAPKGRIILPQVQLIRDCLDHGIKSYVVRDTELLEALKDLDYKVDLVVTDSQAFKEVSAMVPENISLTSFSILFARYKGEIEAFTEGIHALESLSEGDRILISESCTHNHSHEDIGRVKIPKLLREKLGKNFSFEFKMGHDFPTSIEGYDLIIHCGSCMLNAKTMKSRIQITREKSIPITNYGVVLAYLNGILERSLEIMNLKEN